MRQQAGGYGTLERYLSGLRHIIICSSYTSCTVFYKYINLDYCISISICYRYLLSDD